MREVYIIGVAMTPFGRHSDKSSVTLTQMAAKQALDDAGVAASQIDSAYYATVMQSFLSGEHSIPGEYALRPLGIANAHVMRVEGACASSTLAFQQAVTRIACGLSDIALTVGTEKLYTEDRERRFAAFQQPMDIAEVARYREKTGDMLAPLPAGVAETSINAMMDFYAMQARLHMASYGTTAAQIAAVAAKDHVHSQWNERAQYRKAMSVADILAAPLVSWPLTVPMCAPISDGAAAAILCSGELLKRLGRSRAVRVLAVASLSGSDRKADDYANHVTRLTAAKAYNAAGIGPEDVSVAEVHDASSIGEMIQIEALGLCAPGQSGPEAQRGLFSIGGKIPANPSGGLISKGHPMGATGLGQIYELVTQLRGEAGQRQVASARIAVAENSGGFYGVEDGLSCVSILQSG